MCDVCQCGVSSNVFSYLRRISDVRVAYLAYQWRMCYVRFATVEYVKPVVLTDHIVSCIIELSDAEQHFV